MKTISTFIVIALTCTSIFNTYAQPGIRAGFNISTINHSGVNEPGQSFNTGNTYGAQLGFTYEFRLKRNFAIESGIFAMMKGFSFDLDYVLDLGFFVLDMKSKGDIRLYYTEIPLLIKKYIPFKNEKTRFYLSAGSYIGYGVYGNNSQTITYVDGEKEQVSGDIVWGEGQDTDNMKRVDPGLLFGMGIQFGKIYSGVNYSMGLDNIFYTSSDEFTSKNRVFSIVTGVKF